jgi:hypothetical protein
MKLREGTLGKTILDTATSTKEALNFDIYELNMFSWFSSSG